MTWLPITLAAYCLNGLAILIDKILLRKVDKHPVVYAFYVNILGAVILPVLFFVPVPHFDVGLIALGSGALFTLAMFVFFWLLRQGEASRIAPLVGSLQPVGILILAWLLLNERLSTIQFVAFFLILAGSWNINQEEHDAKRGEVRWTIPLLGFLAALLFSISYVGNKYVLMEYTFWGSLAWRTLGSVGMALLFLLHREGREEIFAARKHAQEPTGALFIIGQLAGAGSFILVYYAIMLGSTALVSALSGVQYVFLFLTALFLSERYPTILKEQTDPLTIGRKVVSLLLICLGIVVLFAA